jgi:hypothetical protein
VDSLSFALRHGSEDDGATETNGRLSHDLVPGPPSRVDSGAEASGRHVTPGLGDEEQPARLQEGPKLRQEAGLIVHFVHDPERQDEVGTPDAAQVVPGARSKVDALSQTCPLGSAPRSTYHPLLQIDCDDTPLRPNETGHTEREMPEAATDIHDGVAWPDELAEKLGRVMDPAPQTVVEGVGEPPGTSVSTHARHGGGARTSRTARRNHRIRIGCSAAAGGCPAERLWVKRERGP